MGRWVTIPEAVAHFDRNERTIRRWIKRGTIRHKNEGGRALVLVYALSDKGPDRQPDIGPDTDRPGPDITPAELVRLKAEVEKLEALLAQSNEERDYLRQALAAAMSKIPAIEASRVEAPTVHPQASQPAAADPEPARGESKTLSWWARFWHRGR